MFSKCSSLTQITIPSSVTSIRKNALYKCKSLTQITIPSSVISIGDDAFSGCSLLSDETIELINSIKSRSINNNNNTTTRVDNECNNIKTSINNSKLEDENNQKLMNEFEIKKMLDHPNILKAVDIIYDDKKAPSLSFEECPNDLNQVIQNKMFSKVQLASSIYQIAKGMKCIHSNKSFKFETKKHSHFRKWNNQN